MIVSFSVANFRSIAAEQTLNLVASNRFSETHAGHAVGIPNSQEKALRAAVLYGANGAGKSNLFKALTYLRTIALEPRAKNSGTGRETFRFGDPAESSPSSFDLQFIVSDQLYRFGFVVDDQNILEEWLVRVEGGREKPLYERARDKDGATSIQAGGLKKLGSERLTALVTVGGPQNQSFLATIRATLDEPDYGDELRSILQWFNSGLRLVGPNDSLAPLSHMLAREPGFLEFAGEFLKSSSTGIDHLEVSKTEITEDELRKLLPASRADNMIKRIQTAPNGILQVRGGSVFLIDPSTPDAYQVLTIKTAHEHQPGQVVNLDLPDESDGTRRLLELTPALFRMSKGDGVYFIDEIDRSMHPLLVWKYLEYFLGACTDSSSQIIVTTHESNLLDLALLRRDEIWFAEKDAAGASQFYSLSDFKVRKDLEIRKHYLQGRFGAIPFLGNLDLLTPPAEAEAAASQPA